MKPHLHPEFHGDLGGAGCLEDKPSVRESAPGDFERTCSQYLQDGMTQKKFLNIPQVKQAVLILMQNVGEAAGTEIVTKFLVAHAARLAPSDRGCKSESETV